MGIGKWDRRSGPLWGVSAPRHNEDRFQAGMSGSSAFNIVSVWSFAFTAKDAEARRSAGGLSTSLRFFGSEG